MEADTSASMLSFKVVLVGGLGQVYAKPLI